MSTPDKTSPNKSDTHGLQSMSEADKSGVPPIGAAALREQRADPDADLPSRDPSIAETAKDVAREAGEEAKSRAANLADRAKAEAGAMTDKAKDTAYAKAEEAKEYATSEIDRTAERVRDAGREFGADSYPSQAADYLASSLHDVSEAIRSRDLSTAADEVSDFARRNPALFLGGAALLGFAVGRMAKASERSRRADDSARYRSAAYDRPAPSRYDPMSGGRL